MTAAAEGILARLVPGDGAVVRHSSLVLFRDGILARAIVTAVSRDKVTVRFEGDAERDFRISDGALLEHGGPDGRWRLGVIEPGTPEHEDLGRQRDALLSQQGRAAEQLEYIGAVLATAGTVSAREA